MKTRIVAMTGAFLTAFSVHLHSQINLTGTVKNEQGEPLSGASVFIPDTYQGVSTNAEGKFRLKLKDGTYEIRARFLGYEELAKNITVSGTDLSLDFILKEKGFVADEIVISATRAGDQTPTTYTNLSKEEIEDANFTQDLPYFLEFTPSTVVTSDAGGGVGYTGIRIRGVDPTRTNVTVNGIPINDSESHGMFWVNMPDFASSVESIQVQRGVGTSTNGAAAFGASINMNTNDLKEKAYAVIDNSVGSFNTLRHSVQAGTGLLNDKFAVDARLSKISSDGYIDRASSDLKSFYLSAGWYGKKSNLRANIFSGKEITYQAWYGTPESRINGDVQEMNDYADRNWLTDQQRENLLNSGRTYNFYEYENEVDNYQQDHYQLHFSHQFNTKLFLNISGHYTRGRGFYEQYREDDSFSDYGFNPVILGSDTVSSSDLIRRRWLDNHFYGAVYSLHYNPNNKLNIIWGGGANVYDCDHFGEVIWARFASDSEIRERYYDNNGLKYEGNSYLKATYRLNKVVLFGDMQYRYINYTFLGIDEVGNEFVELTQTVDYHFLNPKAGFIYDITDKQQLYASYSVGNREPVRADFRESSPQSRPEHEHLDNIEMGYTFRERKWTARTNLYLMHYTNQLILTGQINDVGGYTRINVPRSYRAGIEIEAGIKATSSLEFSGNLTLSRNKITRFTEYVDDYDNGGQIAIEHQNTDIAFSPNIIAAGQITYEAFKNFKISLMPKYVGDQYLDNTSDENRKLNGYFLTNFRVNYKIENLLFKEIHLGFLAYNILNTLYENNGYTFSYFLGGETITENFYYPQSGVNVMFNLRFTL